MKYDCIAILLGRKGSKGIPGKNKMEIIGRPINHYPVLAALNSKYINELYLSTDDDKIIEQTKNFDLELIERPPELCTDSALFEDALVHGYKQASLRRGKKPEFIVILMCNSVTVDNMIIDKAIDSLIADSDADSAVTVSRMNMYSPLRARKINEKGYLDPFIEFKFFGDPETLNCDRDSQGDVFYADMSYTVSRARALDNIDNGLLPQKWMGQKILPVLQDFGCDIDENWQVVASEQWLIKRGFTNKYTPYDQ